jgi:hypothetical protein
MGRLPGVKVIAQSHIYIVRQEKDVYILQRMGVKHFATRITQQTRVTRITASLWSALRIVKVELVGIGKGTAVYVLSR